MKREQPIKVTIVRPPSREALLAAMRYLMAQPGTVEPQEKAKAAS